MKKITKAAIAGTLGAALLIGGAGSLAFWTDTENGAAVQIQSGNLDIGTLAEGTWTIQQNATGVAPAQATAVTFTPATHLIVPGDVLATTTSVPVTLTGKNIKATLGVTVTAVAKTAGNAADVALATALNASGNITATIDGGAAGAAKTFTASSTAQVKVTVTFPWGNDTTTTFNDAKLGNLTFQTKYTLTQIPVGP